LEDKFLQCGKYEPEVYLDPSVRAGISSFSADANKDEVDRGLLQMEADIASGKIKEVMNSYDGAHADYAFMIATREE
jgi:hypothetical protein